MAGAMLAAAPAEASSVTPVGPISLSSKAGGVQHVKYEFSFTTSATGGLSGPSDTITIAAPGGTVLKNSVTVHDDTTGQGISVSGILSNANATLTLTLCCTEVINAGDKVTITLND